MSTEKGFSAIQFIGTQRSGSNLLRVMLNQLPEISAPHPPHILKTFFPLLPNYGDLQKEENFFMLAEDVCAWVNVNPVPWEGIYFNAEEVIAQCRAKSLVEIFRVIYEMKARVDDAPIWCCKSMESVLYLRELEQAGIHPTYIHIYRDGRDVALSFLKAIVGPKHIFHLANKWRQEQLLSLELRKQIPAERFISVKYEELLNEPRKIMQTICDSLHIPFRESALDYFHSHESLVTAQSGAMWKNLLKPIMKENHDKFLKELTNDQIQIFEFIAGDVLEQLGYLCVSDITDFTISESDIQMYDLQNRDNIKKVLLNADKNDITKRQQQENLLMQIKQRSL